MPKRSHISGIVSFREIMEPFNVLFVGDSHINKLKGYVHRRRIVHFNLPRENVVPTWRGESGRTAGQLEKDISRYRGVYSVVFIVVGSNDLGAPGAVVSDVATSICNIIEHVKSWGVSHIIVPQIFRREHMDNFPKHNHISINLYNSRIYGLNKELMGRLKGDQNAAFWKVQAISRSKTNIFEDGVHLNDYGHWRLFCSFRAALVNLKRQDRQKGEIPGIYPISV